MGDKEISYNPFKMWGSWVGLFIGLFLALSQLLIIYNFGYFSYFLLPILGFILGSIIHKTKFFKITKIKIIYLIIIGIILIISEILANNVINCIQMPCGQSTSTIIGQIIYLIFTFNTLNIFISIILHYTLISLLVLIINKLRKNKK